MPASAMKKLKDDDVKMLGHFVDLLDKMMSLDPTKRPTPKVSRTARYDLGPMLMIFVPIRLLLLARNY